MITVNRVKKKGKHILHKHGGIELMHRKNTKLIMSRPICVKKINYNPELDKDIIKRERVEIHQVRLTAREGESHLQ